MDHTLATIAAHAELNLAGTPAPGRPHIASRAELRDAALNRRTANDVRRDVNRLKTDADVAIAKCNKALAGRPPAPPQRWDWPAHRAAYAACPIEHGQHPGAVVLNVR